MTHSLYWAALSVPPARGREGDTGWAHEGKQVVTRREVARDQGGKVGQRLLGAGLSPHPSFWSGFSCRPESRRMRQSSYLSKVPEAPAAR